MTQIMYFSFATKWYIWFTHTFTWNKIQTAFQRSLNLWLLVIHYCDVHLTDLTWKMPWSETSKWDQWCMQLYELITSLVIRKSTPIQFSCLMWCKKHVLIKCLQNESICWVVNAPHRKITSFCRVRWNQ